jgi:hypothetical protein
MYRSTETVSNYASNIDGNFPGPTRTANGAPERGAVATNTSGPVTKRAPSLPW